MSRRRRAFSYARFSSRKQSEGFSLIRQLEAAKAYCERNNLDLDEQTFCDEAMSGFHGANAVAGELGRFLALVKDGHIPKNSVLIIENLDRLSRLPPDQATKIVMDLVNAGIEVVTLSPEQRYTKENIHSVGVGAAPGRHRPGTRRVREEVRPAQGRVVAEA
jgi:DNA invertase Pin-like site-specific DNA recombinase